MTLLLGCATRYAGDDRYSTELRRGRCITREIWYSFLGLGHRCWVNTINVCVGMRGAETQAMPDVVRPRTIRQHDRGSDGKTTYGGDTQSRNLRKKLAQVSCASFLHQFFVQVHASSDDDTSNKNGRSWTKQITFSILSVDHSMGTQNFYLNDLNKFKK